MKKRTKVIKNLTLFSTIAVVSITSGYYTSKESDQSHYRISEPKQQTINTSTTKETNIEFKEGYFQRNQKEDLTIDDIILTIEEKGHHLSNSAQEYFNSLNLEDYINETNKSTVALYGLAINEDIYAALTDQNIIQTIENHQNIELYDSDKDQIKWDLLKNKIKTNNNNALKKDEEKKKTIPLCYKGYESLSDSDINIIINQFQEVTNDIKLHYPSFDIKELACHLEKLALLYETNTENTNQNILAYTAENDNLIAWLVYDNNYPDLNSFYDINEHEIKHYITQICDCYKEESRRNDNHSLYTIIPTGINIDNPHNQYIMDYYQPLRYSFIEEALAEKYARKDDYLTTYIINNEALNNIQMALSLTDYYDKDMFMKSSTLQNPIAMLQQFPVSNANKNQFLDNIRMLSAFETTVSTSSNSTYQFAHLHLLTVESPESINQQLICYANLELNRIFFQNLIIMNESTQDFNLEYNIYLMKLFSMRTNQCIKDLDEIYETNTSTQFYETYYPMLVTTETYLSDKYQTSREDIEQLFIDMNVETFDNFPKSISTDKIAYYKSLYNELATGIGLDKNVFENYKQSKLVYNKK